MTTDLRETDILENPENSRKANKDSLNAVNIFNLCLVEAKYS